MLRIDLTGKKFGYLTVVKLHSNIKWVLKWDCQCECGKTAIVAGTHLKSGHTISCGCKRHRFTHGMTGTVEYIAWQNMIQRCYYPSSISYPNYGARGISVCDRWRESFENFFEDIGPRPSKKHSLERNNTEGNYGPDNCRWATKRDQERNKRKNRWIEHNGERMIITDWARYLGIPGPVLGKWLKTKTMGEILLICEKRGNG